MSWWGVQTPAAGTSLGGGLGERAPEPAPRASLGPSCHLGTLGSTFTNGWPETKAQTQDGGWVGPEAEGRAGDRPGA